MSIIICSNCGVEVDTDYNAEVQGNCTECAWELGLLTEEE